MKETSEYGARLKALKKEQQRIERKQAELLEKRRADLQITLDCLAQHLPRPVALFDGGLLYFC
jgi:hypothetical protein